MTFPKVFCIFIVEMSRTLRVFISFLVAGVALLAALLVGGCAGDPSLDGLGMPEFLSLSGQANKNSIAMTCTYKGRAGMCGFVVTADGSVVKKQEASERADGSFSLTVSGLEYDKEYTFYAWISNGSAEIHSNTEKARTEKKPVVAPKIVGVSFTADENVLILHCTYEEGVGVDVEECGFYFGGVKMAADTRSNGAFSLTIKNLEYDKEYDYQAYLLSGQTEVKSSAEKARTGKMASIPIPDAAFKAYLLDKFDLDKNGKLGMDEAEKITRLALNTFDLKIKSLEGIEYFANLQYLEAVGHGNAQRGEVARLDLSKNTKLETLYCSFNKLEFLDLGNNSNLKTVDCSSNMLTNVNMADRRPDFSGLSGLEYLDCHANEGLLVYLGSHPALKYLDCNHTVGFDYAGNCPVLEYLDCSSCSAMMLMNVSGLKKLSTLKFEDNGQINEFDATGCESLVFGQSIFKGNTFSYAFKASGCSKLTSLEFESAHDLSSIDVSGCIALKSIKCNEIGLEQLNIGGCTALTDIECFENYIAELDVSSQNKLNLKAWPQKDTFSRLWIGSGEYHYYNSSGTEVNPADYGTEVKTKE